MRDIFVESLEFTEWVEAYLTDEGLAALQRDLLRDPQAGDVMPGCGGLRNLRIADRRRGKGKRGGGRVIYRHSSPNTTANLEAISRFGLER